MASMVSRLDNVTVAIRARRGGSMPRDGIKEIAKERL